jgi:hypothetical protein
MFPTQDLGKNLLGWLPGAETIGMSGGPRETWQLTTYIEEVNYWE